MITYNEDADLSIRIKKPSQEIKSFSKRREVNYNANRGEDSKWYKSLPNRKIKD
jgi:hypothetical protein